MRRLLLIVLVAVAGLLWYFAATSAPASLPRVAADPAAAEPSALDPETAARLSVDAAAVAPVAAPDEVRAAVDAGEARDVAPALSVATDPGPASSLTLHVRVVDALGTGVRDAEVFVRRFPPELASATSGEGSSLVEAQQGRTDVLGETTLGFSGGGGFWVGAHETRGEAQQRLDLDVGVHHVELQLEPAITLRGVVRDTHTLEPIGGSELELFPAHLTGRGQFVSDDQGRFEFVSKSGVQSLQASASGYSKADLIVHVRDGDQWSFGYEGEVRSAHDPLEVLPSRERSIQGRVVDPRGTPIRDALVEARGYTMVDAMRWHPDQASARTDSEGRFALAGLRADIAHILWASEPSHSAVAAVVEAGAPDRDVGTMQLGHPTSLRGRAQWTHADGTTSPAAATKIYLSCSAALSWEELGLRIPVSLRLETETDQDGAFLFENAPLGRAQLRGGRSDRWLPLQLENDHAQLDEPLVLPWPE